MLISAAQHLTAVGTFDIVNGCNIFRHTHISSHADLLRHIISDLSPRHSYDGRTQKATSHKPQYKICTNPRKYNDSTSQISSDRSNTANICISALPLVTKSTSNTHTVLLPGRIRN